MKELIEQILKEEENARKKVGEAKNRAQEIILEAQKESGRILSEAAEQTRQMVRERKARAREMLFAEKEKRLAEIRTEQDALRKKKEIVVASLSAKISKRIVTIGK